MNRSSSVFRERGRAVRECLMVTLVLAGLNAPVSGQVEEADISDKLKALKIELEEQKRLRDRVIAKRWEDRKVFNDAREKFNQEYDDLKDKLELKNSEIQRARESVEVLQSDVEELKSRLESEKIQFLGLSYIQKNAVNELARELDKRFPALVPQRQNKMNLAVKSAEVKKDSPAEVLDELINLYLDEIRLTRETVIKKTSFLLSDNTPGMGMLARVGMVASAYQDEQTGRMGIILRTANIKGRLFEWREDLTPGAQDALKINMDKISQAAGSGTGLEMALLPMDILRTRAVGKGYVQGEQKGLAGAARSYFTAGGIWMWPLIAIALAALLLLIERFFNWLRKNAGSQALCNQVLDYAGRGNVPKAVKLCASRKNSAVLKAIAAVLHNKEKTREAAEKELQEVILQEGPSLERRLTTISVLGAAAPLLGLLGTVAGMIQLFESITLYGTSDPKLMAGGISVALITTQTGLAIAVPIMIAHNFMANRVDVLINKMETYSLKSLNLLWPRG
ncbi:MotA/TolQ/ExbB proton channel family protein [Fibrobacterota bacterium]